MNYLNLFVLLNLPPHLHFIPVEALLQLRSSTSEPNPLPTLTTHFCYEVEFLLMLYRGNSPQALLAAKS